MKKIKFKKGKEISPLLKKIFICLLVLLLFCFLYWLIFFKQNLDTNSTKVTNLYAYLGDNNIKECNGLSNYDANEVNKDTISEDMKICNAYVLVDSSKIVTVKIDKTKKANTCKIDNDTVFATDNADETICTLNKLDINEIKNAYKAIYGSDLEDYKDFQFNYNTICQYSSEAYYCGSSQQYTLTVGAEPTIYRTMKKAVEKGNDLYIYDYFLKVIDNKCYTNYTGTDEIAKCSDVIANTKDINYNFLKKYGTLYKHTFKKDADGNYYWVSSKPM